MTNRYWLSAAVGCAVVVAAACATTPPPVAEPNYTLNCDEPDQNPASILDTARGLEYGNPLHRRPGKFPTEEAAFKAILVADSMTGPAAGVTVIGPSSEIVSAVLAIRYTTNALQSGKIIGKVSVDTAYTSVRNAAGRATADALELRAGTSYVGACVPKNAGNGTTIKGLIIHDATGSITGVTGTYLTIRGKLANSLAIWQSSSKSTMCIACGRGWCHF